MKWTLVAESELFERRLSWTLTLMIRCGSATSTWLLLYVGTDEGDGLDYEDKGEGGGTVGCTAATATANFQWASDVRADVVLWLICSDLSFLFGSIGRTTRRLKS